MKTYELFTGNDLAVAELIQQRRYQLLIHSCLYYELNTNLISDKKWDEWARELLKLQTDYPEVSNKVELYEYFSDWDASSGAFLPIREQWVIRKAKQVKSRWFNCIDGEPEKTSVEAKPKVNKKTPVQFDLF